MMTKTAFGFISFLTIVNSGCQKTENPVGQEIPSEWELVHEGQNTVFYQGLHFVDQNHGWVVGDSGKVLHTADGGDSWYNQESRTTISFKCVHFITPQRGWIGGRNNSIGRTTDGGTTWTWENPVGESRRTFMAMSFVSEYAGWIVDNFGGILHTEDGGMTWTSQVSGTTWGITSVQFLDAAEGWATATNRVVLHTTDGGNSWMTTTLDALNYGGTTIYTDIFFCDRTNGWIATNVMTSSIANPIASVVETSDKGKTWNCQPTPEREGITSLQFVNAYDGWAGSTGGILVTTNGGHTWEYQLSTKDGEAIVDICFVDPSHGWALTFRGSVYRYLAL